MTDRLVHRGPDDVGHFESPDISLGMRRLAIVDPATGRQPAYNEDGTIAVVFNGEIYNHRELRAELERAGHRFVSDHSDTEVLAHLYEEFGDAFLDRLNGMFAIALWDAPRQRLLLARDRLGIKPLYYSLAGRQLVFGSEIKALFAHPSIVKAPDFVALYHYFSLKNIPAPMSAFQGIQQLRPGEMIIYQGDGIERKTWWRLRFNENANVNEHEASQRIRILLEDSVRLQMQMDVPFGAYLSGGLDSSAVVALMSHIGGRVRTFSLIYADDFAHKAEDQRYARLVAEQLGTDHHEYVLTRDEVVHDIDAVLDAFDEPFSGVTSTYFLTRLIGRHVKVALSGDGADEMFGSYHAHRLAQPLAAYENIRARLGALTGEDMASLAPYADDVAYLAEIHDRGDEAVRRASLTLWGDAAKRELLSSKMLSLVGAANTATLLRERYADSGTADPLNRALYCDLTSLLPDQVLTFVDRLSMAHSVEVRPPFLDHRLVEFAATLPGSLKIKAGRTKHILKEAVRGLIPGEVIDRPKEGFVLPVDYWLLNDLREMVEDTLHPDRLACHGLLCQDRVRDLLNQHYTRQANHGPRIWNLLMFQRWWENCFE